MTILDFVCRVSDKINNWYLGLFEGNGTDYFNSGVGYDMQRILLFPIARMSVASEFNEDQRLKIRKIEQGAVA